MMKNLNNITRRDSIKLLLSLSSALFLSFKNRNSFLCDIGVCTSLQNQNILLKSGCTYVEEAVNRILIPDKPEDQFQKNLVNLRKAKLPVYACNGFLPGSLKSVGADIQHEKILIFAETAFRRARQCGIQTIVFGSGKSRKIPDGFALETAKAQFIELLKQMSVIARKYRIIISLEPLNRKETNFINTLTEGIEIIKTVNHPNLKLLVDIYHMLQEDESAEEIIKAGNLVCHCHIAEKENRTPPGTAGDNFKPFLTALKQIHYRGKISIECRWQNMAEQLPEAVKELRIQISEI